MNNFRENYFIAREIVAQELMEKYNFIESYRDDERLTLDNANLSLHFTFYVPDGDEVYVSDKGKEWFAGRSFRDLLYEKYPIDFERLEARKQIFQKSSREPFSYEIEEIKSSFRAKLNFLKNFSEKFI